MVLVSFIYLSLVKRFMIKVYDYIYVIMYLIEFIPGDDLLQ